MELLFFLSFVEKNLAVPADGRFRELHQTG